jgi:7-carboxy-7-deazaguanine synthase
MANPNQKISITEIFGPTINGEGDVVGELTVFVRTGGCTYKCVWCDSLHAVLPEFANTWKKHTTEELVEAVEKQSGGNSMNITLSGGNPAIQPFSDFIDVMQKKGYTFTMETQGDILKEWFRKLDTLVVSPKPPSSLMTTDYDVLALVLKSNRNVSIKVVIMNEEDYEYAIELHLRFPLQEFFISVGNPNPPVVSDKLNYGSGEFDRGEIVNHLEYLINKVANDDRWLRRPRIIPQVHTLLWGNKGGV